MKNNTRRIFLRNTSLAATGALIVSPLGARNKKIRNIGSVGCAPTTIRSASSTIASQKSGNWSDPATWGGRTPGTSDIVGITANHVVSYDLSQSVVAGIEINSSATLVFDPSKNTVLESSGNILNEGLLKMQPASAAIVHTLRFINVVENNFVGGGMDPLSSDVGLWVMNNGQLDLQGAAKTSWTNSLDTILGGTSNITLKAPPQGWNVGDQLITAPTSSPSNADYYLAFDDALITSISGSSISLNTPMVRTHPKVNSLWTAEVMNITRNVRIEGTVLGKSHIFIRSNKPQTLKYVQLRFMGPRKDINGDRITELVKGRYALHFHHSMDGSRGSIIEGCVIRDTGNHSYVPHVSHGIVFKNNVAYNVTETAFWWDETEQSHDIVWDGNIVALCKFISHSVNVLSAFNPGQFPPSLASSGYLLGRGDDNIAINNVAVGCTGDHAAGGAYNWEANNEGIWKFENNIAHNNHGGLRVWQVTPRHHVIKNFTAYYNGVGIFHGAYANSYKYTGSYLYGNSFEIKAGSTDSNRVRVENTIIDGAGLVDHCIVNLHSPLAGAVATLILNCTLKGSKKEAIKNENIGSLVKGMDVVLCAVTGGYAIDQSVAPLESIRVQNASGQPIKITKQGQTDIAPFAPTLWGNGNGLTGEYFNKHDFTNHVFTRNDYNVSFPVWSEGVHYKITGLTYSVRWTGQVQPQFTEDYTFGIDTGGGFRLWINNNLVLEAKEGYPESYYSRPIPLEAGKKYDIKIEFYNTDANTSIALLWESKSLPQEYVPQSQLYTALNTPPPPPATPTNQPPVANAGSDIIVTLPLTNGVLLNGSATDPDGNITSYKWSQVSGPSSASFSDSTVASPTAGNLQEGIYIFRLTVADNNNLTATDDIQVTVNPAVPGKKSTPIANAGGDLSVTLPVTVVTLAGTGSDPDGNAVSYRWTKVSGSTANIVNDTAASATVTNLRAGVYSFRLTITDVRGTTASDDVQVTVNDAVIQNNNNSQNNSKGPSNDPQPQSNNTNNQSNNGEGQKRPNVSGTTLEVTVQPNPSPTNFTLQVKSSSRESITINVYNRWGKLVDTFTNVSGNSTVTVGNDYPLGFYYANVKQGLQTKVVRLLKVR